MSNYTNETASLPLCITWMGVMVINAVDVFAV